MTHRRVFFTLAAAATMLAGVQRRAAAQSGQPQQPAMKGDKADFLFVQTSRRMSFDRASSVLTLHEVSPVTVMFTDRPERIAGNMRTVEFIPFWSRGRDSFLADPPNADLSIVKDGEFREVPVELRDPRLEGNSLHYTVKVLEGEMPAAGAETSVFIDVIGMPLTPLSYAGARRRMWRRAYWR